MAAPEDTESTALTRFAASFRRGTTSESYDLYYEAKGFRTYLLRSALAPLSSWRWNRFITAFYARVGAPPPVARVRAKPLRSYLRSGLSAPARVAALVEGYEGLEARFGHEFLARFCGDERLTVLDFTARKEARFALYCTAAINEALQREGEVALFLTRDGLTLCRLAMTFAKVDGEVVMAIGGLQGPPSAHKREVIDATREMYGLRPKDAILLAARAFAESCGVRALHAVSDANHVLARLQDKAKFSLYDDYWRERGASAAGPFGFVFPPLEDEADESKRGALKHRLVESTREFVRANRR